MVNYGICAAGYPVYHVEMKDASICEASIVADCGSSHEQDDSWGVAHFLEHMCFQGTPTKNKHQVGREQTMVGQYNAYTSQFNTVYHFNALAEDFERGFVLLKEAVFDSSYPETEFEKEKNVIVEEWRMYDNYPTEHFFDFITEKCFGPAEGHAIIGTEPSIRSMNPEKLHRFRNKWYGTDNISIVVVGNLDFHRVMDTLNRVLPAGAVVEKSPPRLTKFCATDPKYTFETERFEQAAFGLFLKWPSSKESYANRYISSFFSSALSKYMFEYIRDDLGLCYGVWTSRYHHFDRNHVILSMLTNNGYLEKAEAELDNLFARIKSEGFPHELFEISKKQLTYNQVKTLESVHGVSHSVINGIGGCEDRRWFLNEGHKSLDPTWLKTVAAQLTQHDLKEFANHWLKGFTKFSMVSTKKA